MFNIIRTSVPIECNLPICISGQSNVYQILYEEVNESDVEVLHIVSNSGEEEYRYPRAGMLSQTNIEQ